MKIILLSLILIISFSSLLTKIESERNKKQSKSKTLTKKCSKFQNGKFKINIEPYGEITIIRKDDSQIEFRTKEYYTKEKIIWINDCKYKKIYLEINDPIFSQKEADALKAGQFTEEIVEIKDDKHFISVEYRDGVRSIPVLNEKIE